LAIGTYREARSERVYVSSRSRPTESLLTEHDVSRTVRNAVPLARVWSTRSRRPFPDGIGRLSRSSAASNRTWRRSLNGLRSGATVTANVVPMGARRPDVSSFHTVFRRDGPSGAGRPPANESPDHVWSTPSQFTALTRLRLGGGRPLATTIRCRRNTLSKLGYCLWPA